MPPAGPLARQTPFARAAAKLGAAGCGRPHRRGDLARSRVRGASQVVLLHEPFAHGQNHRGDRRGAAGAEPPAQTGPGPRAATPVAARPSPQAPNGFLHNGQRNGGGLRGAVARNGRNAARASGRDGSFQLRIRAGNSACVLTEGIGAFEVWLCSTPHHEPYEAI